MPPFSISSDLPGRYFDQRRAVLFRTKHVHHASIRTICLQRGKTSHLTSPASAQLPFQVVEQYFFSHETFSYQRHLFFTTSILFASMLGKFSFFLSIDLDYSFMRRSRTDYLRPGRDVRNHRGSFGDDSRLHLPCRMLHQTHRQQNTMVRPHKAPCIDMCGIWYNRDDHFPFLCSWKNMDTRRGRQDMHVISSIEPDYLLHTHWI